MTYAYDIHGSKCQTGKEIGCREDQVFVKVYDMDVDPRVAHQVFVGTPKNDVKSAIAEGLAWVMATGYTGTLRGLERRLITGNQADIAANSPRGGRRW